MDSDLETELDYEDDLSSLPDPSPFQQPHEGSECSDAASERSLAQGSLGFHRPMPASPAFEGPTFSGGFRGKGERRSAGRIGAGGRGRPRNFNPAPGGQRFMSNQEGSDAESVASEESWFPIGRPAKRFKPEDPWRGNMGKSSGPRRGGPSFHNQHQAHNPWRFQQDRQRGGASVMYSLAAMDKTRQLAVQRSDSNDMNLGDIHNIIEDDEDSFSLTGQEDDFDNRSAQHQLGIDSRPGGSGEPDGMNLDVNEIMSAMADDGPTIGGAPGDNFKRPLRDPRIRSRGKSLPSSGSWPVNPRNVALSSVRQQEEAPKAKSLPVPFGPGRPMGQALIAQLDSRRVNARNEPPWMRQRPHMQEPEGDISSYHGDGGSVTIKPSALSTFSFDRLSNSNPRPSPSPALSTVSSTVSSSSSKDPFGLDDDQYSALKAAVMRLKEINKLEILSTLQPGSVKSDTTASSSVATEGSVHELPVPESPYSASGKGRANSGSSEMSMDNASAVLRTSRSTSEGSDNYFTNLPSGNNKSEGGEDQQSDHWPPVFTSQVAPQRYSEDQRIMSNARGRDFRGRGWRGGPRGRRDQMFNPQANQGRFGQQNESGSDLQQGKFGLGMGFMGRGNHRQQWSDGQQWSDEQQWSGGPGEGPNRGGWRGQMRGRGGRFDGHRGREGFPEGHQGQGDDFTFKKPRGFGPRNFEGRGGRGDFQGRGRGPQGRGMRGRGGQFSRGAYFPSVCNSIPQQEYGARFWEILPDDDSRVPKTEDGMPYAFGDYLIKQEIVKALDEENIFEPTRLQHESIPELMSGVNICMYGESGSGKTLAHALAVLQQIDSSVDEVQAVIVCPYRERVTHIESVYESCSRYFEPAVKFCIATGGSSYKSMKVRILEKDVQVVIGTFGKVCMLLKNSVIKPETVKILVVEELSVVFKRDAMVRDFNILREGFNSRRQFIGTIEESRMFNQKHVAELFEDGRVIDFGPKSIVSVLQHYSHLYCVIAEDERDARMVHHLKTLTYKKVIIRCETLPLCSHIEDYLKMNGLESLCLDLSMRAAKPDGSGRVYQDYLPNSNIVIANQNLGYNLFDMLIIYCGNNMNAMHYTNYLRQVSKHNFGTIVTYITRPGDEDFFENFDRNYIEVKAIE